MFNLDAFKQRTLQYLTAKNEGQNLYSIEVADLLTVDKCAICGSNNLTILTELYLKFSLNFFTTSICNNCLYTFRSVSPSYKWFKKCWAQISTKRLEVFNSQLELARRERYERYLPLLSKYVVKHSVLDIGAGYGTGSKVFQKNGYTVECLEAEDDRANYIEKVLNLPVYHASVEEFVLQPMAYGVVLLAHCLEHSDNPAFILANIRNLLDPEGGILYVETPVIWHIVTWADALYLAHKSNFTEENLIALAENNGFKIIEKIYFKDEVDDSWNLGLVMRLDADSWHSKSPFGQSKSSYEVDEIRQLYRKGIPITPVPPLHTVITYSVPFIDHFYQTVRLDTKRIVSPRSGSGFITFEPVGDR